MVRRMNLAKVKEIKEVDSVEQANKLLSDGWMLLLICGDAKPVYLLGRGR